MASEFHAGPAVPAWLKEKSNAPQPTGRSHTRFLSRSLHHVSGVFENEFYSERYAGRPFLLQAIDPRVKCCILLLYTLVSAFSSNLVVLLFLALTALLYARFSGLSVRDYARRVWGYLPLMVLLASLPGASSLFLRGAPLFYLLPPGALGLKAGLAFSAAGLAAAVRLALRAGISLSFGFLLLLTTRWADLMGALASMRLPLTFLSILSMAYRYLFVLSKMAGSLIEARFLRTVGRLDAAENRRFMSRGIAALFIRAHLLSGDIYDAMVCRGFHGKPVHMAVFRFRAADAVFLLNNLLILLVLLAGEAIF